MTDEYFEQLLRSLLPLDTQAREARLLEAFASDHDGLVLARRRLLELDEVTLPADATQPSDDGSAAALDLARLQELFAQAVALAAPERAELLRQVAAADPHMEQSLARLLATDQALHGRSLPNLAEAALQVLKQEQGLARGGRSETAGDQIGPWQLVRPLGRGGMGTVWLAQRADGQFQRVVALKLISAGQETQAIQNRFLRERQILASLNHPNIAKLLDGGVAPDGRPYFVLEYVDGQPITSYCDRHQLRVVDRLRLFLQVCRAVQHAHQRLVVHRDLKPSNIMVTNERMVQLLDFGIAKLLHPDLHGSGELTRPEDQAMTPRYAAPEQIRNETITTSTDIYALGVLLYELLTGALPYDVQSQAGHALERAIVEQEPRRPCATLTDPSNLQARTLASQRGTGLHELTDALAGDLETVLLKALKKQPAERYPSVEALAKDLEAYLDGKPVSARPDSWRYRVGKFVGRHKAAVTLSSLAIVSLIAALLLSLQQAALARQEAARAEAVGAFLIGLFEEIDPARGDALGLRARDLLDTGARRVDHELSGDPALQARLNALLGRLLLATGDFNSALTRLDQARSSAALATAEAAEAGLDQARALIAAQRFDEAEQLLQSLQKQAEANSPGQARLLEVSADLAVEAGKLEQARTLAERALALWQQLPGEHRLDRARSHTVLAKVADLGDQLDQAELQARLALELVEASFGHEHIEVARLLERLANLARRRGDLNGARETLTEALRLSEALVGRDHLTSLSLRRLDADLLEELGELEPARAALEAVLADAERRYGRFHLSRALALNSLAAIDFRQRRLADGARRMREVVSIHEAIYGPRHNEVATVLNNLANLERERGRLDDAARLMQQVLAIRRETVGEHSVDYAYSLLGEARIAQLRGEDQRSLDRFEQARQIFVAALGEGHPLVYSTSLRIAHAKVDLADHAGASQTLAGLATDSPDASSAMVRRWLELRLQFNTTPETAIDEYLRLVKDAEAVWPSGDPRRTAIVIEVAALLRFRGEGELAQALTARADLDRDAVLEPRLRKLLVD
jgi:serine/threonine-protein kinase